MKTKIIFLLAFLPCLVFPPVAEAQFSLVPNPLPDCKSFLLTEIGYYYRVSSFPADLSWYESHSYFTSNLGLMINLNPKFSLGAVNFVGLDDDGQIRWGAKARARSWFGPKTSADLSLGLNFLDSRGHYEMPGFSGELSLNFRDLVIFSILLEASTYTVNLFADYEPYDLLGTKKGTDLAIYTGIKIGRKPGILYKP